MSPTIRNDPDRPSGGHALLEGSRPRRGRGSHGRERVVRPFPVGGWTLGQAAPPVPGRAGGRGAAARAGDRRPRPRGIAGRPSVERRARPRPPVLAGRDAEPQPDDHRAADRHAVFGPAAVAPGRLPTPEVPDEPPGGTSPPEPPQIAAVVEPPPTISRPVRLAEPRAVLCRRPWFSLLAAGGGWALLRRPAAAPAPSPQPSGPGPALRGRLRPEGRRGAGRLGRRSREDRRGGSGRRLRLAGPGGARRCRLGDERTRRLAPRPVLRPQRDGPDRARRRIAPP